MTKIVGLNSDAHFGSAEADLPDWRADEALASETDPDDEELDETPPDVVEMLGFDPKEFSDDNPTRRAAVEGALSQVETTDEARAILEELYP